MCSHRKKQWRERRVSLCHPMPSVKGEGARVYLPSDDLATESNIDEQDDTNNDTLPPSADQMPVVFIEGHAESSDT